MSLRHSLNPICEALRAGGIAEFRIEAEVLLRFVLGCGRSDFLSELYGGSLSLTPSQSDLLQALTARRLSGEPLAYITGTREFYGLDICVDERVMIPRQETELLVDVALEYIGRVGANLLMAADVGVGSGAAGLAISANSKSVSLLALDISIHALRVAKRNAERLGLADRVSFVRGDLLEPVGSEVDLIVSNPPYIPSAQIGSLQPEVRREPKIALDGGADGLEPFRRLVEQAASRLKPGGALIVELMPEQMDAAKAIARRFVPNLSALRCRQDLAGDDRALVMETAAVA